MVQTSRQPLHTEPRINGSLPHRLTSSSVMLFWENFTLAETPLWVLHSLNRWDEIELLVRTSVVFCVTHVWLWNAWDTICRTQMCEYSIMAYNSPKNLCGLSLDKLITWYTMVVRRYPLSDLISVVWFYFDRRKTKKQANVQAKPFVGQGKPKRTFCKSLWAINKKLVDNSIPRNPQNMGEHSTFTLRNYFGGS